MADKIKIQKFGEIAALAGLVSLGIEDFMSPRVRYERNYYPKPKKSKNKKRDQQKAQKQARKRNK